MVNMNCPKCGNYVEEGKEFCFMCGTKLGENDFSSPGRNGFTSAVKNDFSSSNYNNMPLSEDYYKKKEEYNNRLNNYRDVEIKRVKDDKKDFIDIYKEYNIFFKVGGILFLIVLGSFIFVMVSKSINKEEVLKPVTQNLYYKVDSTLTKTSDNNGGDVYALTNNKGVSCSVKVTIDNTSSSDHIKDYFSIKEGQLLPTYNDYGDVVDVSTIPLFQEGSIKINNVIWYYMNVYYRKNPSDNYTALRHRFLSAGHNGVFYNLELSNFDDLNECNLTLDSFLRSLQFIDL